METGPELGLTGLGGFFSEVMGTHRKVLSREVIWSHLHFNTARRQLCEKGRKQEEGRVLLLERR